MGKQATGERKEKRKGNGKKKPGLSRYPGSVTVRRNAMLLGTCKVERVQRNGIEVFVSHEVVFF